MAIVNPVDDDASLVIAAAGQRAPLDLDQ